MGVVWIEDQVDACESFGTIGAFSCPFCGHLPHISLSSTSNPLLYAFFRYDAGHVEPAGLWPDLFQTQGILNDTHLRLLLGMPRADRTQFFAQFVPRRLTAMDLLLLTRRLDEFAVEHPWAALPVRGPGQQIARKGGRFEEVLAESESVRLVAHSMRFSEEQYKCLEAHIRRRIPWYLDIYLDIEEQDVKQVEALEDEIRASFPLFNHYKHAWPIRVIVTRVLRKSSGMACAYGVPAPPYTQSSSYPFGGSQIAESEPSPQSTHSRTHRCPPLSRYHAASSRSVPPQAKDTLSFLNMEDELAPALHFLGVRTDAQFDKVRRMRGEQKAQLLADTDDMRLTPLQRWVMMYMIFEK